MPRKKKPGKIVFRESTLCMRCSKATALRCKWMGRGDRAGLVKYSSRFVKDWTKARVMELVCVLECRDFEEGPLPAVAS